VNTTRRATKRRWKCKRMSCEDTIVKWKGSQMAVKGLLFISDINFWYYFWYYWYNLVLFLVNRVASNLP